MLSSCSRRLVGVLSACNVVWEGSDLGRMPLRRLLTTVFDSAVPLKSKPWPAAEEVAVAERDARFNQSMHHMSSVVGRQNGIARACCSGKFSCRVEAGQSQAAQAHNLLSTGTPPPLPYPRFSPDARLSLRTGAASAARKVGEVLHS